MDGRGGSGRGVKGSPACRLTAGYSSSLSPGGSGPRARLALIVSSTRISAARRWSWIQAASRWPDSVGWSRISRRLAAAGTRATSPAAR